MARRRAIPTVWRHIIQVVFGPPSLGLAENVRECEESMDLLSGSVNSSWAAGMGRTKSSASTGGIGPLMTTLLPAAQILVSSYMVVH